MKTFIHWSFCFVLTLTSFLKDSLNNEPPVHVPDDTSDSHNGYQPVVIFKGFQVYDHKAE